MKKILISEEEKTLILKQHVANGSTSSENLKEQKEVEEAVDDFEPPYEKGPSGVRASRSRSDFSPTPKESDIQGSLFGKYSDDIPPIVIRYLRKIGRKTLTKRLIDLDLIDAETVIDEFGF